MFNALAARYQKEARYRSLPRCQQPTLSSRHEAASVRRHRSLSNRDQPVQRVVWPSLSRFGTYCIVTVHATSRSPMDWEIMARRCSDLETLALFLVPDQLMRRARQARTEDSSFVIWRVAIPKTQWQLQALS